MGRIRQVNKRRQTTKDLRRTEVYWGTCNLTGKLNYESRATAKIALKRIDKTMNVYLCECGFHHIGHADAKMKARLRSA